MPKTVGIVKMVEMGKNPREEDADKILLKGKLANANNHGGQRAGLVKWSEWEINEKGQNPGQGRLKS